MDQYRDKLLRKLKYIKEPVALPTVQTMDMGLEYIAASSEGASTTLGRYGAWPVLGPFILYSDDLECLQKAAIQGIYEGIFDGMEIDYIWKEIKEMFDYTNIDENEMLEFQNSLIKEIIEKQCSPEDQLYVYFDKYDSDLPLLFKTRKSLIDYFISLQNLVPWDEMSTNELEKWCRTLEEITEFEIFSPFADDENGVQKM